MTSKDFYTDITKHDLQIVLYNFLQNHTLSDLTSALQEVFKDVITDAINFYYDAPKIPTKKG